jgi:FkbM family methyltransferase
MSPALDKDAMRAFLAGAGGDKEAFQPARERGLDLAARPIVLLGVNGHFRDDFYARVVPQLNLVGIIDNRLAGQTRAGLTIGDDAALVDLTCREAGLVAINTGSSPHFYQLADALDLPCLSLLRAYDLLGLAQPMAMFEGLAAQILDHYEALLDFGDRLADEASRQTLYRLMRYRLTYDLRELQAINEPFDRQFYGNPFMALRPDEVLLEGGAYDGDSIRHFLLHGGGHYARIIAFEPEPANYAKLAAFAAGHPDIRAVCKGLSNINGTLRFSNGMGMASHVAEDGDSEIQVCRIDDEVDDAVTLLKLDIEGAELDALDGARETIGRHQPKLAIAVYHQPGDILAIPRYVEALGREQRLYLRHHSGFHYDTTFYAIPS